VPLDVVDVELRLHRGAAVERARHPRQQVGAAQRAPAGGTGLVAVAVVEVALQGVALCRGPAIEAQARLADAPAIACRSAVFLRQPGVFAMLGISAPGALLAGGATVARCRAALAVAGLHAGQRLRLAPRLA